MSVPDLDVIALADSVLLELCAQHMLGEPEPRVSVVEVARLGRVRDHRGRVWRVHQSDARTILRTMANAGRPPRWPIVALDRDHFGFVEAGLA